MRGHAFRWSAFAAGAAAFGVAHAVELSMWHAAFAPATEYAPWFLNSGLAVAFTAACLFLTSFLYTLIGKSTRDHLTVVVASLVAGAVVAMGAVLAINGPGTLFPVALGIGGLVAAAACASGGFVGSWLATRGR